MTACGNTFHEPSSWRKKKNDSGPSGLTASTRTQRRPGPDRREQRMMRAGAAAVGASHLSTAQRSVFPVVFMMVSFDRKSNALCRALCGTSGDPTAPAPEPLGNERAREAQQRAQRCMRARKARMHLLAAAFTEQAPCTEVFAVVGQEPVAVFAEARASAADGLPAGELRKRMRHHGDRVPRGKLLERDFRHRATMRGTGITGVMNDLAAADINAVMRIAAALRGKVRAERGFVVETVNRDIVHHASCRATRGRLPFDGAR